MQKWEFHFIQVNSNKGSIVTRINGHDVTDVRGCEDADTYLKRKGDEGWELVAAIPQNEYNPHRLPQTTKIMSESQIRTSLPESCEDCPRWAIAITSCTLLPATRHARDLE